MESNIHMKVFMSYIMAARLSYGPLLSRSQRTLNHVNKFFSVDSETVFVV
jgi:DNA-directed RNA polymerase subunit F